MKLNILLYLLSFLLLQSCKLSSINQGFQAENGMAIPGIQPTESKNDLSIVIFVHGMGYKDQNYSYFTINKMAKTSLGNKYTIRKDVFFDSDVDTIKTQLEKFIATNKEGNKSIVFYSLRYSNLSDTIKEVMRENEAIVDKGFRRGFVAKVAKNGFIDQFKDVMKVQEEGVLPKIVYYFDLAVNDAMEKYFLGKDNVKINFVTSSLGSAVTAAYIYDFYLSLAQKSAVKENVSPNFDHAIFSYFSLTDQSNVKFHFNVYQLTNQLVLFGTSIQNWGNKKTEAERLQMNVLDSMQVLKMKDYFDLNIYSYRNQNDDLCLYVPPLFYQELLKDNVNVKPVINIHYTNLLLHNDPISAHTFPLSSGRIAKRLANGVP